MSTPSEEQMQELVCHHAEKTFMFPGSDHHGKHVRLHAVAAEMRAALTALQAENKALRDALSAYVDADEWTPQLEAMALAALTAKREEGGR